MSAPQTKTRRPDASMSLLSDLMTDSLDAGYRLAAQRRALDGPSRRRSSLVLLIAGTAVLGLLMATAFAQENRRAPSAAAAKQRLGQEVEDSTDAADRLERKVSALRTELGQARRDALALTGSGRALSAQLASLEAITGVTPVAGPGVELRIEDAKDRAASTGDLRDDDEQDGRVVDRDLQIVVNGLWDAGAEAVSINGRRLTSLTAIRAAGEAILVDYRPLSPPYVVRAIGDPGRMEARFADGPGGRYLKLLADNFGVRFTTVTQEQLSLPAASGVMLRAAASGGGTEGAP